MQFSFLDYPLNLRYRGPNRITCDAAFNKGDEMGYFQHGSTIIVLASQGFKLADLRIGSTIRMGAPLMVTP